MDDYANVFWSAWDLQNTSIRVGQDMGGLGGMISCEYPFPGPFFRKVPASMAVNSNGLPVMAGIDSEGCCFLSSFDPIKGSWGFETLSELGLVTTQFNYPFAVSITYDSEGETVLAFLEASSQKVAMLREGISGWEVLARESAKVYSGRSLTSGPDGSVAMAYVDIDDRVVYGNSTAAGFAIEEVSSSIDGIHFGKRFGLQPYQRTALRWCMPIPRGSDFGPLYLATRGVDGIWTNEQLPVSARSASLAFDSLGNAIIAAPDSREHCPYRAKHPGTDSRRFQSRRRSDRWRRTRLCAGGFRRESVYGCPIRELHCWICFCWAIMTKTRCLRRATLAGSPIRWPRIRSWAYPRGAAATRHSTRPIKIRCWVAEPATFSRPCWPRPRRMPQAIREAI